MNGPTQSLVHYYCTDENIATRFKSDFELLCGQEYLAKGSDGAFNSSSPWNLTSASTAFDAQGAGSGSIVILKGTGTAIGLYVIDSSVGSVASLRRINMPNGIGVAPGMTTVTGVSFTVPTLSAQIENASYQLEREFGISSLIAGRRQCDLFDPREVREVCVLMVAKERYFDLARQASEGVDLYLKKAQWVDTKLTRMLDQVTVHWADVPEPMSESGRFGTRLVR